MTPTTADDAARRHAAREENQPDARVAAAAPSASGAAAPQPLASAVDARFAQREEPPDSVAPQPPVALTPVVTAKLIGVNDYGEIAKLCFWPAVAAVLVGLLMIVFANPIAAFLGV